MHFVVHENVGSCEPFTKMILLPPTLNAACVNEKYS